MSSLWGTHATSKDGFVGPERALDAIQVMAGGGGEYAAPTIDRDHGGQEHPAQRIRGRSIS